MLWSIRPSARWWTQKIQIQQAQSLLSNHQCPGTTTGSEDQDHHTSALYQAPTWHVQTSADMDRPTSHLNNHSNHSFCDRDHSGLIFLTPSASSLSIFPPLSRSLFSPSPHTASVSSTIRESDPDQVPVGLLLQVPCQNHIFDHSHPLLLSSSSQGPSPPPFHQPQHPPFPRCGTLYSSGA